MIFIIFITFLILQRLLELIWSKRNEKWLLQNGAVEYGQRHYPYIVLLHILFIASLILEHTLGDTHAGAVNYTFLALWLLLIVLKIWVIASLGQRWNTRIYHIPGSPLIRTGPYKFFKHPNYLIVICEILLIPLVFKLYFTAVIFSILNAMLLYIRIKEEDKALRNSR